MKGKTLGKILLLGALLILPAAAGICIGTTRDMWKGEDYQYTDWALTRAGISDTGLLAYWIDYSGGEGELNIRELDANGVPTGKEMTVREDGRDIWAPFFSIVGDVMFLSYTRTSGDLNDARLSRNTPVELIVQTLDIGTWEPCPPVEEPMVAAAFEHRGTHHGYIMNDEMLYAWFNVDGDVTASPEFGGKSSLLLAYNGSSFTVESSTDIKPERAVFSISSAGSFDLAIMEMRNVDVSLTGSNESYIDEPWDGMDLVIVGSGEGAVNEIAMARVDRGLIEVRTIRNDINGFDLVRRVSDTLYFQWEEQIRAFALTDSGTENMFEINSKISSPSNWGIAPLEEGNATFCWSGTDLERGDEDDSLFFLTISWTGEISDSTLIETVPSYYSAKMVNVQNGTIGGLVLKDGSPDTYNSFILENGRFREVSELESRAGIGFNGFMIGLVLALIMSIIPFAIALKGSSYRAFRKMSLSQLQMFNEKQLARAIGKEAGGWTKEEMISYLTRPEVFPERSREEENRLFNLLPARYIYFSIMIFGFIVLFPNIVFSISGSPHPAYLVGMGTHLSNLIFTVLLSILVVLSLGEWNTTGFRRLVLSCMFIALFVGEFSLASFMVTLLSGSMTLPISVNYLFIITYPLMVLALSGPFFFLYDRTKQKKTLIAVIMFAVPLTMSLMILPLSAANGGIVPTPARRMSSLVMGTSLVNLITCMFIAMGAGMVFSQELSLNTIKPLKRWTREDLDRSRRLPFLTAILGWSLFTLVSIYLGLSIGTALLGYLVISAVMGGLGIFLMLLGTVPWFMALGKARKMDEIGKDISSIYLSVFFTPGLTLMGGITLAMTFGLPGALLGSGASLFQLIYGNIKLRQYTVDCLKDIKNMKPKAAREKTAPEVMKRNRMHLPRKPFVEKIRKNQKGLNTALWIVSVLGLLLSMFGEYIPQAMFIRDLLPESAAIAIYLVVLAAAFLVSFIKMRSLRRERNPLALVNTAMNGPIITIGIISVLFLGAAIGTSMYFLIGASILIVGSFFISQISGDAAIRRFDELPPGDRMVYPSEMLIFGSSSFTGPDPNLLKAPPDVLSKAIRGGRESLRETGKEQKGTEGPEREEDGQICRGNLLFREAEKVRERRIGKARRTGVLALVVGMVGLLFAVYLVFSSSICWLFFMPILVVMALTSIAFSLLPFVGKGSRMSVEFHEGGAVDHSVLGGKDIFIPYGNFANFSTIRDPVLGKVHILRSPTRETVWLYPGQKDAEEHVKTILSRIGKAEFAGYIDNQARKAIFGKVMPVARFVLSIAGALISSLVIYLMGDFTWKLALLSFPTTLLVFHMIIAARTRSLPGGGGPPNKNGHVPKLQTTLSIVTVVIALVVTIASGAIVMAVPGGLIEHEIIEDEPPKNHVSPYFFNGTGNYTLDRDMLVRSGEELVLEDTVILLETWGSDPVRIWIEEGGRINARGTSFISNGSGESLWMEIHGRGRFTDCVFSGIWGDPHTINGQGGIEVYGDSTFDNCTFRDGTTNLIMVVESSVTFRNCRFTDAEDDAVEVVRASIDMFSCTVEDVVWGMVTDNGARVRVEGCLFRDVQEGIALQWSSAEIRDTRFQNVTGTGIRKGFGSTLQTDGCTFDNVGTDISNEKGFGTFMFGTCILIPVVIGGISLAVIFLRKKKESAKTEGPDPRSPK